MIILEEDFKNTFLKEIYMYTYVYRQIYERKEV